MNLCITSPRPEATSSKLARQTMHARIPFFSLPTFCLILLTALLLGQPSVAQAQVTGRIVRFEAPASWSMGIYEIEVWSGGKNVVLQNKEVKFAGFTYRGRDINERKEGARLIDGRADFSLRASASGVEFSLADGLAVNPWVELDIGRDLPIEKLVISQPAQPLYHDRAIRLVTVLDAERHVVWSGHYDLRQQPCVKGLMTFALAPGKKSLTGRTVPAQAMQWVPLGEVLVAEPAPEPPDAAERAARFAARNSPAAIEQLAAEFFARMDLSKPELANVRSLFERWQFAAALDAYRDHFLAKLQRVTIMHEWMMSQSPYEGAAEDMQHGIAVVFTRRDALAQRFTPGVIDWAAAPDSDQGGIDIARAAGRAGIFQKPLLARYRATGRAEDLALWIAITDDWGMNIRRDLDRAKGDLRFYFVKDVLQEFNHLADSIGRAAKERPEFGTQLPGATLARMLIPVLEEYPPAYWWVCRRASFNHTYNALNAATVTSRLLDDFHAGQRLDKENRQHWERVWTSMMTRDGSMNEIADEGHMFMQLRMGAFFQQMKLWTPWFTPDFAAEFETGWRQTTSYPIRHLSPDGRGHRFTRRGLFGQLWDIIEGKGDAHYGRDPSQQDSAALPPPAEVVSILQRVFGAGHDRAALPTADQEKWEKVTARFGTAFTPPTMLSDWMPYAGLHYLRRSWEPDATFIHMISQPKGHPSSNGSAWNTEVHLFDYGQPLLACSPVWIDGQTPFNEADTLTFKPGSKTETLATASERPIAARWHTSTFCDYAESFYEGTYQRHQVKFDKDFRGSDSSLILSEKKVEDARATRRVIMLRPTRLVIVTDAVSTPTGAKHAFEVRQRFAIPEPKPTLRGAAKKGTPGKLEGDARALTIKNEDAPGVTVRRFTTAELSWDPRRSPESWQEGGEMGGPGGATMMTHNGVLENRGGILRAQTPGNLLMSALIEPHRIPGETVVKSATDLSRDEVTGFKATLHDSTTLTWLSTHSEAQALKIDGIILEGDGLLVWQSKDETRGLALGAKSLSSGGKPITLPGPDFEFTLKNGTLASTTPIHRPIQPVTFSPQETVFLDKTLVTLTSETPGVEIRYTLDGKEPDASSLLYTTPINVDQDSYIRARAFRIGVKTIPFTTAGTDVTVVSEARYHRRELKPAVQATKLVPGLRWELVEGNWFSLFSHLNLPAALPAKASGQSAKLLDPALRQNDGTFGLRYEGFLEIPADGVWTFHAPAEYVGASCEPGYDLRVWIDGEEWDLGQRFHGLGQWSVPLAKGAHRLLVTFADARHRDHTVHAPGLWRGYPTPWVVWKGDAPEIQISGPGHSRQPVPTPWLKRTAK